MTTDSGYIGDITGIVQRLGGRAWLTSIDLASRFFRLPIAEPGCHNTAFRDAFECLWKYEGYSFGLKLSAPAFASIVADLLGDLKWNGVETYLERV